MGERYLSIEDQKPGPGSRGGVEDTRLEAKAKAKDRASEDRSSRGQRQKCSRPRTKDTGASVLLKKDFQKFFQAFSKKKNKKQRKKKKKKRSSKNLFRPSAKF